MRRHRNSQKRIYSDGAIYSITTITKERYPYFENSLYVELFIENLKLCKILKDFRIHAFNVLYDHVHLLIEPGERYNISQIMQAVKKGFARDINYVFNFNKYSNVVQNQESAIAQSRFLWEEYYGYLQRLKHSVGSIESVVRPFQWHKSFHDHIIRNEKDYDYHYSYIVENHLKHYESGYPEDYKYTSLKYAEIVI